MNANLCYQALLGTINIMSNYSSLSLFFSLLSRSGISPSESIIWRQQALSNFSFFCSFFKSVRAVVIPSSYGVDVLVVGAGACVYQLQDTSLSHSLRAQGPELRACLWGPSSCNGLLCHCTHTMAAPRHINIILYRSQGWLCGSVKSRGLFFSLSLPFSPFLSCSHFLPLSHSLLSHLSSHAAVAGAFAQKKCMKC